MSVQQALQPQQASQPPPDQHAMAVDDDHDKDQEQSPLLGKGSDSASKNEMEVAVYKSQSSVSGDSFGFQIFAAFAFMTSAMSLLLLNKSIMRFFPYTFTVIFLQDFITVVMASIVIWAKSYQSGNFPKGMSVHEFLKFLPAMCFFLITLVSGLEVFKYISVVTFIALRYITCYFSYFGEVFVLKNRPQQHLYLVSLALIGIGAGVYASADLEFSKMGYVWLSINIVCHSAFALYVKWIDTKTNYDVFIMSLFNNLQTLLPLLICSFIWKELPSRSPSALSNLAGWQHAVLWCSCVAGFCISVTGFYAQKLFSATAWTIQSNLNKIPTMIISVYLFHSKVSWGAAVGAFVLLLGGSVYSLTALHYKAQEDKQKKEQEKAAKSDEAVSDTSSLTSNSDHSELAPPASTTTSTTGGTGTAATVAVGEPGKKDN